MIITQFKAWLTAQRERRQRNLQRRLNERADEIIRLEMNEEGALYLTVYGVPVLDCAHLTSPDLTAPNVLRQARVQWVLRAMRQPQL